MGAMLHDNFEMKIGIENPESLSTIHTLAFFLPTTGAASIPSVYPRQLAKRSLTAPQRRVVYTKTLPSRSPPGPWPITTLGRRQSVQLCVAARRHMDRTPKRCQEFSHLTLIVGSGLANEVLGRFADSQGMVDGIHKNCARISRKKLLARGFRLKNETFFFELMMMKVIRATSCEVSTKNQECVRAERRNQLATSMLEKGGAQRACGDANCVVRSRTQRQLHGKLQVDFDPETGSHLHFSHLSVRISTDNRSRTDGLERAEMNGWDIAGR